MLYIHKYDHTRTLSRTIREFYVCLVSSLEKYSSLWNFTLKNEQYYSTLNTEGTVWETRTLKYIFDLWDWFFDNNTSERYLFESACYVTFEIESLCLTQCIGVQFGNAYTAFFVIELSETYFICHFVK